MSVALAAASPSRRRFLAGTGALTVSFALFPKLAWAQGRDGEIAGGKKPDGLPGSLKTEPMLDAWIRVGADGGVLVFTGKAELGQGIKTALIQVAAEELAVDVGRVRITTADTELTPNEGYTAGSHSMQDSGTAIMNAAAQVREILIGLAARRFGTSEDGLTAQNGEVRAADGRRAGYGELVAGQDLHVRAQPV